MNKGLLGRRRRNSPFLFVDVGDCQYMAFYKKVKKPQIILNRDKKTGSNVKLYKSFFRLNKGNLTI